MRARQARRYEMLQRVKEFGEAHRTALGASTAARQLLAVVGAQIDAIARQDVPYVRPRRAVKGEITPTGASRDALYTCVSRISRTARIAALDRPGLDKRFRMPRSESDSALLAAAELFARNARTVAPTFVAHGLPPAFIDDLRARAAAFEQILHDRGAGRKTRAASQQAIDAALRTALAAVRRLDVIIENVLPHDEAARAIWKEKRRLTRV